MDADDTTPIPLSKAVEIFFPYGGATTSTLRGAIRNGLLAYEKLGNRYFVTAKGVSDWRLTCRVNARAATTPKTDMKSADPARSRAAIDEALYAAKMLIQNPKAKP